MVAVVIATVWLAPISRPVDALAIQAMSRTRLATVSAAEGNTSRNQGANGIHTGHRHRGWQPEFFEACRSIARWSRGGTPQQREPQREFPPVTHRYDESGRVFLAGCSPAEPTSASSTSIKIPKPSHERTLCIAVVKQNGASDRPKEGASTTQAGLDVQKLWAASPRENYFLDIPFYRTTKQLAEKGFVLNDTGPQGLKPD